MNKPLILGHRGYRKKFTENTMLAFDKAFEFGADGIECDVQKSADGVYFIFHDDDLKRMTGFDGRIDSVTSDKIRSLDAGMKQRIPDIDTFLESLPRNKLINIELKEETLTVEDSLIIIDKLNATGMKDNILISSFMHELLPPFKRAGFKTGLLYETVTLTDKPAGSIFRLVMSRPWSVNLPVDIFTGRKPFILMLFKFVASALRARFIFWTVNSEDQYKAVSDFAYTVITDDVEGIIRLRDNL